MKRLHFANIANVAYGYGKILRAAHVEADVLCYDLGHILSLPEWVEGDYYVIEILHFELPFNYLFMNFEKPTAARMVVASS